jgi:hypothetical protein
MPTDGDDRGAVTIHPVGHGYGHPPGDITGDGQNDGAGRQRRPARQARPRPTSKPARSTKLQPHPDAPTRGFAWLLYVVTGWFRWTDPSDRTRRWAPNPGRREEIERAIAEIIRLVIELGTGIFAFVNRKGGSSKTTTIIPIATILHKVTGWTVVVVDANKAGGDTETFSGVADFVGAQTITTQHLYRLLVANADLTPADLVGPNLIAPSPDGVLIISHDPMMEPEDRFTPAQWDKVMAFLTSNYPMVFLDLGNDCTDDGSIRLLNYWASGKARTKAGATLPGSILIPTTVEIMDTSISHMAITVRLLRAFGVNPYLVEHAIGVFSNGKPRHLKDYLADAVLTRQPEPDVILARFTGPAFVVQPDPRLQSKYLNQHGFKLSALRTRTVRSYYRILIALLQLAIEVKKINTEPRSPAP